MLTISQIFNRELDKKKSRNWDRIYVLVDIHDTIIPSDYKSVGRDLVTYKYALPALRALSKREDVYLILWSSCTETTAKYYLDYFKEMGVDFDSFNKNEEEKNTPYACFDSKPYFNVIIDDKAGFEPDSDWRHLLDYLNQ